MPKSKPEIIIKYTLWLFINLVIDTNKQTLHIQGVTKCLTTLNSETEGDSQIRKKELSSELFQMLITEC